MTIGARGLQIGFLSLQTHTPTHTNTHTHTEYAIPIVFLLLQWLHECASTLRYACIAYYVGSAFKNTAKVLICRNLIKACV